MTNLNAAATITSTYSELMHRGDTELAAPLELMYRRIQKANPIEKQKVFNSFLDYCVDYNLPVRMIYEAEKKVA